MLDALQNEGMATYVGYEAASLFPAPDEVDYRLLENPKDVARLLREVNDLFARVGTVSVEELHRLAWQKGVTDRGYYVVGAVMAQTIDSRLGRAALIGTLSQGPLSFVRTYNSLVRGEERVQIPASAAETGEGIEHAQAGEEEQHPGKQREYRQHQSDGAHGHQPDLACGEADDDGQHQQRQAHLADRAQME